jgi:hypothetical protein
MFSKNSFIRKAICTILANAIVFSSCLNVLAQEINSVLRYDGSANCHTPQIAIQPDPKIFPKIPETTATLAEWSEFVNNPTVARLVTTVKFYNPTGDEINNLLLDYLDNRIPAGSLTVDPNGLSFVSFEYVNMIFRRVGEIPDTENFISSFRLYQAVKNLFEDLKTGLVDGAGNALNTFLQSIEIRYALINRMKSYMSTHESPENMNLINTPLIAIALSAQMQAQSLSDMELARNTMAMFEEIRKSATKVMLEHASEVKKPGDVRLMKLGEAVFKMVQNSTGPLLETYDRIIKPICEDILKTGQTNDTTRYLLGRVYDNLLIYMQIKQAIIVTGVSMLPMGTVGLAELDDIKPPEIAGHDTTVLFETITWIFWAANALKAVRVVPAAITSRILYGTGVASVSLGGLALLSNYEKMSATQLGISAGLIIMGIAGLKGGLATMEPMPSRTAKTAPNEQARTIPENVHFTPAQRPQVIPQPETIGILARLRNGASDLAYSTGRVLKSLKDSLKNPSKLEPAYETPRGSDPMASRVPEPTEPRPAGDAHASKFGENTRGSSGKHLKGVDGTPTTEPGWIARQLLNAKTKLAGVPQLFRYAKLRASFTKISLFEGDTTNPSTTFLRAEFIPRQGLTQKLALELQEILYKREVNAEVVSDISKVFNHNVSIVAQEDSMVTIYLRQSESNNSLIQSLLGIAEKNNFKISNALTNSNIPTGQIMPKFTNGTISITQKGKSVILEINGDASKATIPEMINTGTHMVTRAYGETPGLAFTHERGYLQKNFRVLRSELIGNRFTLVVELENISAESVLENLRQFILHNNLTIVGTN